MKFEMHDFAGQVTKMQDFVDNFGKCKNCIKIFKRSCLKNCRILKWRKSEKKAALETRVAQNTALECQLIFL